MASRRPSGPTCLGREGALDAGPYAAGVIARFLVAVGRHRRVVLIVGMVLSVGYLLVHLWVPSLGQRAFPAMSATVAVLVVLSVVAMAWRRPTAFVVQPRVPAFSTPPQAALPLLGLAFLTMGTGMAGNVIRDWGSDRFLIDPLLDLGWVAAALLNVAVAWRGRGVQLRPDGLWQRGITGWLVVPWDAAPAVPTLPPPPRAITVPLAYGRPELVRRRGLHVRGYALHTDEIDPRLITAAIRYYVAHPEHRPAIGTQAEHDRLLPVLLDSPAAAIAERWR